MAKKVNFNADDLFTGIDRENSRTDPVPESASTTQDDPIEVKEESEKTIVHDVPVEPVEPVVHDVQQVKSEKMSIKEELLSTKGRKGMKLHKIHILCTNELYEYIDTEPKRRGMSRNEFINTIVDEYMRSPKGRIKLD